MTKQLQSATSCDPEKFVFHQLHDTTIICSEPMSKRVVDVIEDDPSLRTSLTRLLRAHGYACETWNSAEEFWDGFTMFDVSA